MMNKNSWRYIKSMIRILFCLACIFAQEISAQDFRVEQKKDARVKNAYQEKEASLKQSLMHAKLPYPPKEIYIRIFKTEQILELWVRCQNSDSFQIFKEYKICASSGEIGPKRKQGDGQVPEGFYWVDGFNPNSNFHLSLKINYPNESDRILGMKGNLGGNICIHGDCVTIGCMPITDDGIKELYIMAIEACASGQKRIPVHIFPARFKDRIQTLQNYRKDKRLNDFWTNLKYGYEYFEKNKRLPNVSVKKNGMYQYRE
jgi:murein L,D-transpeptidase YafK